MGDYTIGEIVDRLSELYVSYRARYAVNAGGKIFMPKKGDSFQQLTNKMIFGHVGLSYAVCVFAGEKKSKFITFDVDEQNPELVKKIVEVILSLGVNKEAVAVSTSGGKGYHVDILIDGKVETREAWKFFQTVMSVVGNNPRVEFRPTFTASIKLPLSINSKTGNMCWFLDDDLKPILSYTPLFAIKPMPIDDFMDIVWRYCYWPDEEESEIPLDEDEEDEGCGEHHFHPEILEKLPVLETQGKRHWTMMQIAVTLKGRGLSMSECVDTLMAWYDEQDPRLMETNRKDSERDAKDIAKWVYTHEFHQQRSYVPGIRINRHFLDRCAKYKGAARKIAFYLLGTTGTCSTWHVTYDLMAEKIGVRKSTVQLGVKALLDDGLLTIRHRKAQITSSGHVCAKKNIYKSLMKTKACDDDFFYDYKVFANDPMWCFADAYTRYYSPEELKGMFTKKELDKIKEALESRKDVINDGYQCDESA